MQTGPAVATALLTANEVSARLGIDRSTVYRMAMDGRLPGVRVGNQWRFRPEVLEQVMAGAVIRGGAPGSDDADISLRAAQTAVLRAAAPLLDVMMVVTDMDGHLLTDVVNPCIWFTEHGSDPDVLEACTTQWREMAVDQVFTPKLEVGAHGFACARSFVRDHDKLVGMVVAGGIGPDADDQRAATAAGLHHLDQRGRARLLTHLPQVAASLSSLTTRSTS